MATTLFDASALVYWLFVESPCHDEVNDALRWVIGRGDDVLACASSLNETYYTLVHHCGFSEAEARQALRNVVDVFSIAPTSERVVRRALESDEPDYEDAVVRACAELNQVDAILSYDRRAFLGSEIPKVDARGLMAGGAWRTEG